MTDEHARIKEGLKHWMVTLKRSTGGAVQGSVQTCETTLRAEGADSGEECYFSKHAFECVCVCVGRGLM